MGTNSDQEFTNMKRKNTNVQDQDQDHDLDMLTLSLSLQPSSSRLPLNLSPLPSPPIVTTAVTPPPPFVSPQPIQEVIPPLLPASNFYNIMGIPSDPYLQISTTAAPSLTMYQSAEASRPGGPLRRTRQRRSLAERQNDEENDRIPPPYIWATDRRARVHTLTELRARGIRNVAGDVRCKTCFEEYELEFDIEEKFDEVGYYVAKNMTYMHDRAPAKWMNPVLPTCRKCGQENAMKPVFSGELDQVNWLFLLLGEMIGMCKLEQLKYLCKHTNNHCTGAKDRLVYLAYLTICNQLVPNGPFHR